MQKKIGIDLGTAWVRMADEAGTILLQQPAVLALDTRNDAIVATGDAAYAMVDRTPDFIRTVWPLRAEDLQDSLAHEMLLAFLCKASAKPSHMQTAVSVPAALSGVRQEALLGALAEAGVKKMWNIDPLLAAGIGAGVDVTASSAVLVADFGASGVKAAVLGMGGVFCADRVPFGGDALEKEVIDCLRQRHQLLIGRPTARQAVCRVACCMQSAFSENIEVKGRSLKTGLPQRMVLNTVELYDAVQKILEPALVMLERLLQRVPQELAEEVRQNGILLTGGMACLSGLPEYLHRRLQLEARTAPDAELCAARGAAAAMDLAPKLRGGWSAATARRAKG